MEIISRGTLPQETLFTTKCRYCLSILRAKRSELEYVSFSFGRPGETGYYFAECPVCHEEATTWVAIPVTHVAPATTEYVAKERK
ncbi:hypothetical protein JHP_0019 [Pseudomonas phage JHP]|nr:hypothetical protein JHP_0019 [Pseudomonas phage JHP]